MQGAVTRSRVTRSRSFPATQKTPTYETAHVRVIGLSGGAGFQHARGIQPRRTALSMTGRPFTPK